MHKSTEASGEMARNVRVVIVAGPSGCGKTTLGHALAAHLGWAFEDADDYHSPEAKAKMASGVGLTDQDRAPWLGRLVALIEDRVSGGQPTILACSALTRAYRERLSWAASDVVLVWLDVPREVLRQRLGSRDGHFAGVGLLESQLAAAETPEADEEVLVLEGKRSLTILYRAIAAWLHS